MSRTTKFVVLILCSVVAVVLLEDIFEHYLSKCFARSSGIFLLFLPTYLLLRLRNVHINLALIIVTFTLAAIFGYFIFRCSP